MTKSVQPSIFLTHIAQRYFNFRYGIEGNVAPGGENIGVASIVTEFAPVFDLGSLFSQADSGAFNGSNGDCDMEQDVQDDQQV